MGGGVTGDKGRGFLNAGKSQEFFSFLHMLLLGAEFGVTLPFILPPEGKGWGQVRIVTTKCCIFYTILREKVDGNHATY